MQEEDGFYEIDCKEFGVDLTQIQERKAKVKSQFGSAFDRLMRFRKSGGLSRQSNP